MKVHLTVVGKIILSFVLVISVLFFISIIFAVIAVIGGLNENGQIASIGESSLVRYSEILLLIISAYAMHAMFERNKGWTIGIRQSQRMKYFSHGALAGIIMISICGMLIWACGGIHWERGWHVGMWLPFIKGLILFIAVAVSEEVYLRGYILGLLRYHYGKTTAILFSSMIFALLHSLNPGVLDTPLPLINLLMAGIVLGIAREMTGGLWWPIGFHLTWNFFQGYVLGYNVSGVVPGHSVLITVDKGPGWLSGGRFGIEGSVIALFVFILGALAVYYYNKRERYTMGNDFFSNKKVI